MAQVSKFSEAQIDSLAKVLGDCVTGTEITNILKTHDIEDKSGESTKWKRLYSVFIGIQERDGCSNKIIDIIQCSFLDPSRFIGRKEEFENHRQKLNRILAFSGLEYGSDGQFRHCAKAQTVDEAEKRAQTIESELQRRNIHEEILKYCCAELLEDNLFHAVLEATKGLAECIREKSGVKDGDGVSLVEKVFSIQKPILAFNTLETETEKSEHKGFSSLLKGCFSMIRNPIAHQPKILWKNTDDIADYFSLISLLHRKLDDCTPTQPGKHDDKSV